ncbi:MAG: Crp/Fnr family transcriptional regulator [Sporomusaceae bacterium]|nr:Crp/Fnr family transcriptional regulator [Sporomusaceae bacterium]
MNHHLPTLLMSSSLFNGISVPALENMVNCLQPNLSTYKKNSYITLEGDPFTGLGVLLIGEAAVIKENAAGNRNIMTVLRSGDIFGEMIAFSGKDRWPATVFAQADCSVIFLRPDKITGKCDNACASHTQLIKNMLTILSEKALLLNRKVEYLSISSMRGKISTYLLEQHKSAGKKVFDLSLNRNNLADFLNVSRTSLSREMGRMRDEGLIEFYRSSIKINDVDALKKFGGS